MSIVGTNGYTYELIPDWGALPERWVLGQTSILTDSQDLVYLYNRSTHPMVIMDRSGKYIGCWWKDIMIDAHGGFIDENDNLYLPIRDAHIIGKYSRDGDLLMTIGTKNSPSATGWTGDYRDMVEVAAGPFNMPTDISLTSSGHIFVSDGYGNARIHKFDNTGTLLFSWGNPGKITPGHFHVPHGIWVHNDNKVFVADRENNRIQIFNIQGDFITEWTGFARPCGFFIDATDTVFVPELDGFISILTITGDLITRFSGPSGAGAHAVWVDKYGDLYINQHLEGQRILKYARC